MRAVSPDVFGAAERLVIYPFPDCRHPYRSLWQHRNGHCIEARHAVGLGPERDATRCREGLVDHAKQHLAIMRDVEPLTFGTQPSVCHWFAVTSRLAPSSCSRRPWTTR